MPRCPQISARAAIFRFFICQRPLPKNILPPPPPVPKLFARPFRRYKKKSYLCVHINPQHSDMEKKANYISSIEIKALWKGGRHIKWTLRPDVNILSGINGVGKSTIINRAVRGLHLLDSGELRPGELVDGITIHLSPDDATSIRYDVIHSFDRPLLHSDLLEKLSDARVNTELDWQIYKLQKRYLDYQVNIGNRIIELLTTGDPADAQQAAEVSRPKILFQDMIDQLFADTRKTIDRKSNEIQFEQNGEILTPYQLSSGEKQLLVILTTVLIECGEPYALLMDEPEISLHIEWQQQLIALIRRLNPNAQIILSTHSPALIMDGWTDVVTEVEEITNG